MPTLVLSGELDLVLPPRFGRPVAAGIPNARFEVMAGEAHQPFQEVPVESNARVEAFWREVEARGWGSLGLRGIEALDRSGNRGNPSPLFLV
jgi:hypothetical protein